MIPYDTLLLSPWGKLCCAATFPASPTNRKDFFGVSGKTSRSTFDDLHDAVGPQVAPATSCPEEPLPAEKLM